MKYTADYKEIARNALRGNWRTAIATGFLASVIGANIATGIGVGNFSSEDSANVFPKKLQDISFTQQFLPFLLVVLIVWGITIIIIGGAGKLGYAKFNLNLVDQKPIAFSDLFSQFNRLGTGFFMNFLMVLYISLWSMLFVIPGIVKTYSYAMTPYILTEHPEITPTQAITASRQMMHGNKWRLFFLQFSFIGWELLCIAPPIVLFFLLSKGFFGLLIWIIAILASLLVNILFLLPYREAANAAFYRDVSFVMFKTYQPVTPNNTTIEDDTEY